MKCELIACWNRAFNLSAPLTVIELEHVFSFREHVLGIACQFAARNRSQEDIVELRRVVERYRSAVRADPTKYGVTAFPASQIWGMVIRASHSHVVDQACAQFSSGIIWASAFQRKIAASSLPHFRKSRVKLWKDLVDRIEAQDEQGACETGASLVKSNWGFLQPVFKKMFPAS